MIIKYFPPRMCSLLLLLAVSAIWAEGNTIYAQGGTTVSLRWVGAGECYYYADGTIRGALSPARHYLGVSSMRLDEDGMEVAAPRALLCPEYYMNPETGRRGQDYLSKAYPRVTGERRLTSHTLHDRTISITFPDVLCPAELKIRMRCDYTFSGNGIIDLKTTIEGDRDHKNFEFFCASYVLPWLNQYSVPIQNENGDIEWHFFKQDEGKGYDVDSKLYLYLKRPEVLDILKDGRWGTITFEKYQPVVFKYPILAATSPLGNQLIFFADPDDCAVVGGQFHQEEDIAMDYAISTHLKAGIPWTTYTRMIYRKSAWKEDDILKAYQRFAARIHEARKGSH